MATQAPPSDTGAPEGASAANRPTLLELPPEVLLQNVLPILPLRDLLQVALVNKELHALANDPGLWRTKMQEDFSYSAENLGLSAPRVGEDGASSGRDAGWFKRVYLGLTRPHAYLWGESTAFRLTSLPDCGSRHTPFRPVPRPFDVSSTFTVPVPSEDGGASSEREPIGIVELQAGGWSFAARDASGNVWVWGTMTGRGFTRGGWENPHFEVELPARIPLPGKAVSIALGRNHLLVLDTDNLVWEMRAWGRAYQHTAGALTAPTQTGAGAPGRAPHVAQIAAGWEMSAALTAGGDIHVWFPFTQEYVQARTPEVEMDGPVGIDGGHSEGRMFKWGKVGGEVVSIADPIPPRPEVSKEHDDIWSKNLTARAEAAGQQVIKIACGRDFVVALRRNGEVWAARTENNVISPWEYMRHFSGPSITHISAQFTTFAAYSTPIGGGPSKVLLKRTDTIMANAGETLEPDNIPGLDELPVVQITAGDWHTAALTSKGEMYTWGSNDQGQLGNGDRERRETPTLVEFPPGEDGRTAFVFSVAAAGMHTGALVLGYKPKKVPQATLAPETHNAPRGLPGRGIFGLPFRIGYAGRGAMRGGSFSGRGGWGVPPGPPGGPASGS